jgi:hypothetical protein
MIVWINGGGTCNEFLPYFIFTTVDGYKCKMINEECCQIKFLRCISPQLCILNCEL